jgi:hypothetical protein
MRGLGFEGGYDAIRRYAKGWSRERGALTAEAYVPLSFEPGEAYQFDWSHEVVLINNTTVTLKVAHVRLCPPDQVRGQAPPDVLCQGLSARDAGNAFRCSCRQARVRSLHKFGCMRSASSGGPARAASTTT